MAEHVLSGRDTNGKSVSIVIEYLQLQKHYEAKYGERTIILAQIGSFYEMYGYDPSYCLTDEAKVDRDGTIWNDIIGHAPEISLVLNSTLTQENGHEPYSIHNPHKVGFPMVAYEKNKKTLLAHDFVIVRIDQDPGPDNGKRKTRHVAEVVSPTTQINGIPLNRATSNIACLYLEYQAGQRFENFLITSGIAVVDIVTGDNRVCEFYSKQEDEISAVQDVFRFLVAHKPREVLLYVDDLPAGMNVHSEEFPNAYIKYLEQTLELNRFDRLTTHVNDVQADYKRPAYQIEFLNKIFTRKPGPSQSAGLRLNIVQQKNDKIIEQLGLERMNYGRIAYLLLMQHCYLHNPDIITRLAPPDIQWLDENQHLILKHNAILQLDLVPSVQLATRRKRAKEIDSLLSILDQTQTHLGHRQLVTVLQNPWSNPSDIAPYYQMVHEMLTEKIGEQPLYVVAERKLKELPDIERLHRRLQIHALTPKELAVLYTGYVRTVNLYIDIVGVHAPTLHSRLLSAEAIKNFNEFLARFSYIFDFTALEKCTLDSSETGTKWMRFDTNPLKPGVYSDIDSQFQVLQSATDALQNIVHHLNQFLAGSRGKDITLKHDRKRQGATKQDDNNMQILTTKAKATRLLQAGVDVALCGILSAEAVTTSETRITSPIIAQLCETVNTSRAWLRERLYAIYQVILEEMTSKYTFYSAVAKFVAEVDLVHCYAKISAQNNYFRPNLVAESEHSFFQAQDLRHPVIEKIIDGQYIPNNLALGPGQSNGTLLYGVNQTGKSSLVKSIGVAIIMAQIGCYTPCQLTYHPYRKMITRLSGMDNMFKGESSFAVEMTELRTALRHADSHTLVIGDELCHGTETRSGITITAATILKLIERKSSFIFATHMHELMNLPCIAEIPFSSLRIAHLSVAYRDDTLIYDRRLQEGPGSSLYGLIVAQSLNLPADFLEMAYAIMHDVVGDSPELLTTERSRYHADVYMDSCALCRKTRNETRLHTHHLQHQADADERGLIGNMPKNAKNNLVVLCESCHQHIHATGRELAAVATGTGTAIIQQ